MSAPLPAIVDIEGRFDEAAQIEYLSKATLQPDGKYRCLANVRGQLCVVIVILYRNYNDNTDGNAD